MRERIFLSVDECASMLGVSRAFIYPAITSGSLKSFKWGRSRKVRMEDLRDFAARVTAESGLEPLAAGPGAILEQGTPERGDQ